MKNNILKQIIGKTREDLEVRKKLVAPDDLKRLVAGQIAEGLFYSSIAEAKDNPALIAEVKFATPTSSNLGKPEELLNRVKQYEGAGANAISIITEKHFFKGDQSFVAEVKKVVSLPILQKDFVLHEYQIYEAKHIGADALLLIARLVQKEALVDFVVTAKKLGMEPVVEVCNEADLEKAVATKARFIAVNARDLDTQDVNVGRACRLMKKIPERFIRLGFSGIESAKEVAQYREAGARGVLVGTSLMRAGSINEFVRSLRQDRVKVKICGVRDLESAVAAVEAGADYLGFNFVKSSRRYIEPEYAMEIIKVIKGKVKIVGIFQNEDYQHVNDIAGLLRLDFVQLHGVEDEQYFKKVRTRIIKRADLGTEKAERLDGISYFLLDRVMQGEGNMVDLERAREIARRMPVFFAGGLTPENVRQVVETVRPFAVDVASGVETGGKKDILKIRKFISNAKEVKI